MAQHMAQPYISIVRPGVYQDSAWFVLVAPVSRACRTQLESQSPSLSPEAGHADWVPVIRFQEAQAGWVGHPQFAAEMCCSHSTETRTCPSEVSCGNILTDFCDQPSCWCRLTNGFSMFFVFVTSANANLPRPSFGSRLGVGSPCRARRHTIGAGSERPSLRSEGLTIWGRTKGWTGRWRDQQWLTWRFDVIQYDLEMYRIRKNYCNIVNILMIQPGFNMFLTIWI